MIVDGNDTTIIPLNLIDSICPEPNLVNVEYITGGDWIDPHDNLMLAYYPYVIRRRTYSNGVVQEDIFRDYGHFCSAFCSQRGDSGTFEWDNHVCTRYPYDEVSIGDSIYHSTGSLELFDKVVRVETEKYRDGYLEFIPCDFDSYRVSIRYDEELSVCHDTPCAKDYPKDSRPSGWYYQNFMYEVIYTNYFIFEDGVLAQTDLAIMFDFYDQYLVIDGRRIDFAEKHNLKINHSFVNTPFDTDDKEGFRCVLKLDASYLGKNFHATDTDIVYTKK